MKLTIKVNKTDFDSGFTRSQRFATFPQNVLLLVAYNLVRDDVTVEKQQHHDVCDSVKKIENRAERLHNSATF